MKTIQHVILLTFVLFTQHALAAGKPLLLKGKQSLYQRVLTQPDSVIYESTDSTSNTTNISAFSIFYVYERQSVNGESWLKLGTDKEGSISGWGKTDHFLSWNHGLTVAFHNPEAHDRVLLLRNKHALKDLIGQPTKDLYRSYYKDAITGTVNTQSPVISIQPKQNIDIGKDFYLMPILDSEDVFMGTEKATLLKVAIVPGSDTKIASIATKIPEQEKAAQTSQDPVQAVNLAPGKFRAGIAFVIDSTTSMGPYIDRTRLAVRKVYESLNYADISGGIDFAAIAYRDNTQPVEGLEYLSQIYSDFEPGKSALDFYTDIEGIIPSSVSSKDFIEDPFAGIRQAVDSLNWGNITARYVVLITDAGARTEGDILSTTQLTANKLQQLARDKNINLITLHLLTPEGEKNHDSAKKQYQTLTNYPGIGDLYYGVETGDIDAYGYVIDTLAEQITAQVDLASNNKLPSNNTTAKTLTSPPKSTTADSKLIRFGEKLEKLGNAIKMQYLQDQQDEVLPPIIESWLVDRDFNDPQQKTLDVRVLLTRDQMSELYDVMHQVLSTFQDGLLTPESFLSQIRTLAAKMSRDPDAIQADDQSVGQQLDELGFMREYIDDLPYQSEIMGVSLEDWQSWPANKQLELVNRLEEKIAWYKSLHNNAQLWYTPGGGQISGSSVYPLSIDMLP